MIQHSVSFRPTWILRLLFLISVTLISACENEENIRPQTQSEPSEPPLPVRDWYPSPKHRQQPTVYAPAQAIQLQPVMAPPAYQGSSVQQPWGSTGQQPVYRSPEPVYQAQPPATQYQQPTVPQYQYQYTPHQYTPRPWGSPTQPNSNQNYNISTETWPQGGYVAPWSVPQTGGNVTGAPAGQQGYVPGRVFYDSNW